MYTPRVVLPAPLVARKPQAPLGLFFFLVLALVFFYPVWPVFIAKKIGPLPELTPQKLLNYLLLLLCLLQFAFDNGFAKRLFERLRAARGLVWCMVALFAWRYLSAILSEGPFYALKFFNYDTLTTAALFFGVVAALPERINLRLLLLAIAAGAAVITGLALAEGLLKRNLLEPFMDTQTLSLAALDKIREGQRRVQSVFASPMMLAQYCAVTLPFLVIAFLARSRRLAGLALLVLILGCLIGIYVSRTRSALVVVLLVGGLASALAWARYLADRRRNGIKRLALGVYGALTLAIAAVFILWAVYGMASGLSIAQVLGLGEQGTTLYRGGQDARLVQLEMAIPRIVENPVWGWGVNIGGFKVGYYAGNVMTLDSLLLIEVVDSGVPALLLLLGLVFAAWRLALRVASHARARGHALERQFARAAAYSIFGMLFFMLTSPLTEMLPSFYMLMALLVVLRAEQLKDAAGGSAAAAPAAAAPAAAQEARA